MKRIKSYDDLEKEVLDNLVESGVIEKNSRGLVVNLERLPPIYIYLRNSKSKIARQILTDLGVDEMFFTHNPR